MDYVKWEDDYGKRENLVKVSDLKKKNVRINGIAREMKKRFKQHGFEGEIVNNIIRDFKLRLLDKTANFNRLTGEFEHVVIEESQFVVENFLNKMIVVDDPRWKKKGRK